MLGHLLGIRIGCARIECLDKRRQAPMQLGAGGPELGIVSDRTNEPLPERILFGVGQIRQSQMRAPGDDFDDEVALDELVDHGVNAQSRQQVGTEPVPDDRRGMQGSFGGRRQPVDAGGHRGLHCGGHADVGDGDRTHIGAGLPLAARRGHAVRARSPRRRRDYRMRSR